jgi:hypothetical protein
MLKTCIVVCYIMRKYYEYNVTKINYLQKNNNKPWIVEEKINAENNSTISTLKTYPQSQSFYEYKLS